MTGEQKIRKALKVLGDAADADILSVIGTNGTIWKVTDTLTGELLGIRDISGFPCFLVDSDGRATVGNGSIHSSSMFSVFSTTQGSVIAPRMTQAQRTAIASPITGLFVYQTDGISGLYQYDSTGWVFKQSVYMAVNSQAGITYTFTLNDTIAKTIVPFTSVNPVTVTVPTNASVAIPVGSEITCVVQGAGTVTVGGTGVTLIGKVLSFTQGDTFSLAKIATDTWAVSSGASDLSAYQLINIAPNVQTGVTYTLVASDSGKQIIITNSSPVTITVPTGLPTGFNCQVLQQGTGQVTFVGSGTTLRYSTFELPSIVERYGVVGIDNISNVTDEFNLYGKLTSI